MIFFKTAQEAYTQERANFRWAQRRDVGTPCQSAQMQNPPLLAYWGKHRHRGGIKKIGDQPRRRQMRNEPPLLVNPGVSMNSESAVTFAAPSCVSDTHEALFS